MARFDRQIDMAIRLIKKNGQLVQWKSVIAVPPDPLKPWKVNKPGTLTPVVICFLPLNGEFKKFLNYLRGTEIAVGSVMGLMAAGNINFTPNAEDVVIRDGVEYRVISVDLIKPNDQEILYTLEFAK